MIILKYKVANNIDRIKLPTLNADGIYGHTVNHSGQEAEVEFRKKEIIKQHSKSLDEISKNHSIPVMDAEVEKFLNVIPQNGWILDVGGCWGWHWRHIRQKRPDVKVVILDFIREHLIIAKTILGDHYDENFYLVHGNVLSLEFDNGSFDGVWSVQATQHIPNYRQVLLEIFRVLKTNGKFSDYNLNTARFTQLIYYFFGKKYHLEGNIKAGFFIRRVNKNSRLLISEIFGSEIKCRYTEILFSPELGLPLGGKEQSVIGKIDAQISRFGFLFNFIARQKSFHIIKRA